MQIVNIHWEVKEKDHTNEFVVVFSLGPVRGTVEAKVDAWGLLAEQAFGFEVLDQTGRVYFPQEQLTALRNKYESVKTWADLVEHFLRIDRGEA